MDKDSSKKQKKTGQARPNAVRTQKAKKAAVGQKKVKSLKDQPPKNNQASQHQKAQIQNKSRNKLKPPGSAKKVSAGGAGRAPRKRANRSPKKSIWIRSARVFLIVALWGILALSIILFWAGYDLPDIHRLSQMPRHPSVTFLARDGQKIAAIGDYYERSIDVKDLPKYVPEAFIATEDRRFYGHLGIDPIGILRALFRNLFSRGGIQGGSTITQQLAKNFLLTEGLYTYRDRSIRRKLQELLLSIWLESHFTKDQILSIYLNRVYFGAGSYGLRAASKTYFNKNPENLSIKQAALLAGLLRAPTRYSPFKNETRSLERTNVVLGLMQETGALSSDLYQKALKAPLELRQGFGGSLFARYFIDWVFEEATAHLGEIHEDLIITTTLDTRLQKRVDLKVQDYMQETAATLNIGEVAAVLMDPSGSVRALVGGRSYGMSQFNRATQAKRQTGSVFKMPVFLSALEKGLTLDRLVVDTPLKIGTWQPKNYGWKARGEITVKEAFAYSVNTATVRIARYSGLENIYKTSKKLGLTPHKPQDLTYALGTAEASLLEMTAAFAVFANEGYAVQPSGITQITTKNGKVLYHRSNARKQVVAAPIVKEMRDLLAAVMDFGTGRKVAFPGVPSFGKSGTSQDYHDAWFIGFTDHLVAGVWMGNDDNAPMNKVTGAKGPGRLWHQLLEIAGS